MQGEKVLYSSKKEDWATPESVLERVRFVGGGSIALDPCSNSQSLVNAKVEISLPNDGLAVSWTELAKGGLVFVNPPYGTKAKNWCKKMHEEQEQGAEIIGLVAARVDTKWWHQYIWNNATAICFWEGRIKFVGAENGAPFPSAVVYWGPKVTSFHVSFFDKGKVIIL